MRPLGRDVWMVKLKDHLYESTNPTIQLSDRASIEISRSIVPLLYAMDALEGHRVHTLVEAGVK